MVWPVTNTTGTAAIFVRVADTFGATYTNQINVRVSQFGLLTNIGIATGFTYGAIAWGDYDNDGRLDFAALGASRAAIYHNNGDGTFSDSAAPIIGCSYGALAWGDYNGDGDNLAYPDATSYSQSTNNGSWLTGAIPKSDFAGKAKRRLDQLKS